MSKTMSIFGPGAIILGIVIPALTDNLGIKPLVIIFFLLSALMPLSVIYTGNNLSSLLPFVLFGSSIIGCFPIVLATIPSETVLSNKKA